VQRIRLYVKAKGKFHDNLGHKEHRICYPDLYRTSVNLTEILHPSKFYIKPHFEGQVTFTKS
jgi:hypothetical protein